MLSWSSGKDSAWALQTLRQQDEVEIAGLLTTVRQDSARIAMHEVRSELLEAQALATGLPLRTIPLPNPCSNAQYAAAMGPAMSDLVAMGVSLVAFGDLFLEDIRAYREERLTGTSVRPLFPLWGQPTDQLARTMLAAGLEATLTCVDANALDASFAGRSFDHALLADLPDSVDPCGELGEFHTFAHAGPMFQAPIPLTAGAISERDGFVYADLRPPER
ncbi:MAG: Diphthamide synthase (EF-2-diphthine--ammonia ligase) [Chloroflexi bacterium]|nr:MAG: Diphthamide synthase (EF-2-diphthine--ammonia ligase) [Chloroflexota bacterium]